MNTAKYIALDVDSTLCRIEGIDELARMKGKYQQIAKLTERAMAGQHNLSDVFQQRLSIINPNRHDLRQLSKAYISNLHADTTRLINWLKTNNWNIYLISGGFLPALKPLAKYLGINRQRLYANHILFNQEGQYDRLDKDIPLWQSGGKAAVLQKLRHRHPGVWVMVGDGISDWETHQVVDHFLCFTGIAARPTVIKMSKNVTKTHQDVIDYLQKI